jgi:golgi-specific brefeldin A-resistance guanine nucleotide exchange factor 1
MSSSGYLVPPNQEPAQEKLWVETWKRLDRFLPDLRKELDLDEPRQNGEPSEPQSAPIAETTTS